MGVAKAQGVAASVTSTETLVADWDVKDVTFLSVRVTNTGSEALTAYFKRKAYPGDPWGPSPLAFDTPAGDGVLQPGETGHKDVDCAANSSVGLFGASALVSTTLTYSVRPDEGTR